MGYAEFICKYAKVADSTTTQMWRGNKWDSRTEGREHHQTFLAHDPPEGARNPAMCHGGPQLWQKKPREDWQILV